MQDFRTLAVNCSQTRKKIITYKVLRILGRQISNSFTSRPQILKPKGFYKILPLKPNKSTIHTQKLDKNTVTRTVHVKTNSTLQTYNKTG